MLKDVIFSLYVEIYIGTKSYLCTNNRPHQLNYISNLFMRGIYRQIACLIGVMSIMTCYAQFIVPQNYTLFPRPDRSEWLEYFKEAPDSATLYPEEEVEEEIEFDDWGFPSVMTYYRTIPAASYRMPIIYDTYHFLDTLSLAYPDHGLLPDADRAFGWLDEMNFSSNLMRHAIQNTVISNPKMIRYFIDDLPEPPKQYKAIVDPETTQIVLTEVSAPVVTADQATGMTTDIDRRIWLTSFNAGLQFSQAYISPNWYQGGKNNLNMLANIFYSIKLNDKFYKNLMFETTMQYKLGLNNAPDDTLRAYSISEDLLQINSKFGLRAANRWYYSVQLSFKTQILSSYNTNTRNLKSAFLSPGELNVGVGMTYNYENPKKTVSFGASISPLSWNMKSCVNDRINETSFGIKEGHKVVNQFGSSGECNLTWKIAYNISYRSRLFAFTDYDYFQGDWEHTLNFNINRYLTTQIYAHMRYDTSVPHRPDSSWQKFQFKEILSFGLSYTFK